MTAHVLSLMSLRISKPHASTLLFAIFQAAVVMFFLAAGSSRAYQSRSASDVSRGSGIHYVLMAEGPSSQPASQELKREIIDIEFEVTPEGNERVTFSLSNFFSPQAFVLQGEKPRVVCDFYETSLSPGIERSIEVGGRLVKRIRVASYEGSDPKVRIVLDLMPQKDYEIEQTFYKGTNLYMLVVKPGHMPAGN